MPSRRWIIAAVIALATLFAINVGVNQIYSAGTDEQVALLAAKTESLRRLDPNSGKIREMEGLVERAVFSSFTTFAPFAIARRNAVTRYLHANPHLSLGVAIDDLGPGEAAALDLLRQANRMLARHSITLGLADAVKLVTLPQRLTRSDMFFGVTTAFANEVDYHVAMTGRRCVYVGDGEKSGDGPSHNRIYSFGRRRLTIVDAAATGVSLARRVALDLARYVIKRREARRWRSSDYDLSIADVLGEATPRGENIHRVRKRGGVGEERREIAMTIGLDGVTPQRAVAYVAQVNQLFKDHGLSFVARYVRQHQLLSGWRWPQEIDRLQRHGKSDIYVLLTGREWSPRSGSPIRGLSSQLFGAAMVQAGNKEQTVKRLAHELGHLFGLGHTFLKGHVMYPSEAYIGLRWSPGSVRALAGSKNVTAWNFVRDYPERLKIAERLSPPMVASGGGRRRFEDAAPELREEVWVRCD